MVTPSEALVVSIATVAALQVFVSLRLLASDRYAASQKGWQLLLIWLIPFFGAVVVQLFMQSDTTLPPGRDTSFTSAPGGSPEGIGCGSDHA